MSYPSANGDIAGFQVLLARASSILVTCGVLVALAYFFVDRPVAHLVHDWRLNSYSALQWMTKIPVLFEAAAPILIVAILIALAWRPLPRWSWTLLAAALNLLITLAFAEHAKYLFGRYWPDTWIHNNPSLLGNGEYGFHPFHMGTAYDSFPSGHTARIVAVVSVVWLAYPKGRWLCLVLAAAVMVGLVGMNYHFVGDVIGGAGLGAITGLYAAHFFQLDRAAAPLGRAGPAGSG